MTGRDEVSTDDLERFLSAQRWFAGKGRTWQVREVTTVGWLRTEPPAVALQLVTVGYDDGDTESYQLPVVHHPELVEHLVHALIGPDQNGQSYSYDALHDKEATRLWLDGIRTESRFDGLTFTRDAHIEALPDAGPSMVIGAEQSNTSVIFGDTVILKVFRKVSPGLNPDIEVHSALQAEGSQHIAPVLGWLDGTWPGGAAASLAMAQTFLHNATEGWASATASVRDLYAEADLHAHEVGGDFAAEAHRLGVATAEVHADLARALPTATLEGKELASVAEGMRARLDRTAQEVPELARHADALRAAFDDVAVLTEPVPVQRVHGDFHLGQVMRTLDGWKLLDFEGEPARPLEERRALDSPLKDIAGMLRSFDYAARHLLADHPADPRLDYRAVEWADRNRDAFCAGYASAAGQDPRKQAVLLRAFETDKAVYEVAYEARNRPSWLPIPMSAIERLAAGGTERGAP
ncbi:MAG: maltokinase [Actinomycetota bacterium]|nr:maltokinase [Actinomycetota bacterium]